MFSVIALLLGGLLLLYKGADWLVSGSSSLAVRSGLKPIVIGLTVVAFGTSAPELFVSLTASLAGKPDLAISNIIGSNIANVLLIFGVLAAIRALQLKAETVSRQIPLALLASCLVWVLANDRLLTGRTIDRLDMIDGLILLAFFLVFLYYVLLSAKHEWGHDGIEVRPVRVSVLLIMAGLLGLLLGGKLTVDGATDLARLFGLSERFIGLTVVAIGTSLPELFASVMAVWRHHDDIAIGNIIGSNIFNIFWILGVSAVLRPLPVSPAVLSDIAVSAAATALLFVFTRYGGKMLLRRWQGLALLVAYGCYLAVSFLSR